MIGGAVRITARNRVVPTTHGEHALMDSTSSRHRGFQVWYGVGEDGVTLQTIKDLLALPPARLKWLNGKLLASFEQAEEQRQGG